MTATDLTGLLIVTLYIFSFIGLSELLRRRTGWTSEWTRKVVHIGVGMVMWIVPFVFDSPIPFIIATGAFAVLLVFDNRMNFFPAMASSKGDSNLGTVYFPLAVMAVTWLFWETPALMVAILMPLTWGDGMAAVIGRKFGRNKYTIFNQTRSLEGSAAYAAFGFLFTWLALFLLPNPFTIAMGVAALAAAVVIVVTVIVEAISVHGLDNLAITAVAAIILALWSF